MPVTQSRPPLPGQVRTSVLARKGQPHFVASRLFTKFAGTMSLCGTLCSACSRFVAQSLSTTQALRDQGVLRPRAMQQLAVCADLPSGLAGRRPALLNYQSWCTLLAQLVLHKLPSAGWLLCRPASWVRSPTICCAACWAKAGQHRRLNR